MAFTSKNLQSKTGGMTLIKGATLFFLGMSCVLFLTQAFDIVPSVGNRVQLIKEVLFTTDGSQGADTGAYIDGLSGNAYFAGTVTGTTICLAGDTCRTTWPTAGGNSVWSTGSNRIYYNSGNVGIGTDNPSTNLDVIGTADIGSGHNNSSKFSSILGGESNGIEGFYENMKLRPSKFNIIAGGVSNIIGGEYDFIGGGLGNSINSLAVSAHGGGITHIASRYSNILGGNGNNIYGSSNSNILGGQSNVIQNSSYSIIAGGNTSIIDSYDGVFLWSDAQSSNFTAQKDNTFLINATNGVGIGTGSPAAKLHVDGDVKIGGNLKLYSETFSSVIESLQGIKFNTNGSSIAKMTITTDGNVGIGTGTPSTKLHVAGATKIDASIQIGHKDGRCDEYSDRGTIVYTEMCSAVGGISIYTPAFLGCVGSGVIKTFMTGTSWTEAGDNCVYEAERL